MCTFKRFVVKKQLEKKNRLGQIGNIYQTLVYFGVPVAYTVNEMGMEQVKVKTAGYDKQRTAAMCCPADGQKLPPYIF